MHKFRKLLSGFGALCISVVMTLTFPEFVSAEDYQYESLFLAESLNTVSSKINAFKSMILNSKPYYELDYDVFDYCRIKNEVIKNSDVSETLISEETVNSDNVSITSETDDVSENISVSEQVTTVAEDVSVSGQVTTVPANTSVSSSETTEAVTEPPRQPKPDVSYTHFGIDVSVHQGTIDWEAVKNDGVEYAILRAGYGSLTSQIDKNFETNYLKCKSLGIPVGAYWYSYAKTTSEAEKEAETFIYALKGKKFEYPVYFDIEDSSQAGLNRQLLTDIVDTFCARMESAGYYAGIYTNVNWIDNILYKSQLTQYDKWLAHWSSSPKYGSSFGGMWQFGSYGTYAQVESGQATMYGQINGISAACDVNVCYIDYPDIIKSKRFNGY
jgi:GH25 family lysozyme M1 (1,4-beta-N-acetylmuramidase)